LTVARSGSGAGSKALSIAWLLLIQWPRGLWLHTRLVIAAVAAVLVR
jgi:hypothetical protein